MAPTGGTSRRRVFDKYFASLAANPDVPNRRLKLLWLGAGTEDFLYKQPVEEYLKEKRIEHQDTCTGGGHTWMNTGLPLPKLSDVFQNDRAIPTVSDATRSNDEDLCCCPLPAAANSPGRSKLTSILTTTRKKPKSSPHSVLHSTRLMSGMTERSRSLNSALREGGAAHRRGSHGAGKAGPARAIHERR